MSLAEQQALALRDLAVHVAQANGNTYQDDRLRIVYTPTTPQAVDVFKRGDREVQVLSVVWRDDCAVVVLHKSGSWEDWLLLTQIAQQKALVQT